MRYAWAITRAAAGDEMQLHDQQVSAWNNLAGLNYAEVPPGDDRRAAVLAATFWGLVSNSGIDGFLVTINDVGTDEVLHALSSLGALKAARRFELVVAAVGGPLPPMQPDEREDAMTRLPDFGTLDLCVLPEGADEELLRALEDHIRNHVGLYAD